MKILEIRASLLEVSEQELKDHKGAAIKDKNDKAVKGLVHSKHVHVVITDPKVCAGLQEGIEQLLAKEQSALSISGADAVTLDNCADASKFELTGKVPSDDKAKEALKAEFLKQKAPEKPDKVA